MIATLNPETVGHLTVCSLSLLAGLHYLSHYPREARRWLRHYRHAMHAACGRHARLRRWILRLALISGLTLTFAPGPLYVIHSAEAASHLVS